MATSDNAISRALHKLLDKRYEGAVRLAARAETKAQILALWERLRDSGQIGAGYWAIMPERAAQHVARLAKRAIVPSVIRCLRISGHGALCNAQSRGANRIREPGRQQSLVGGCSQDPFRLTVLNQTFF